MSVLFCNSSPLYRHLHQSGALRRQQRFQVMPAYFPFTESSIIFYIFELKRYFQHGLPQKVKKQSCRSLLVYNGAEFGVHSLYQLFYSRQMTVTGRLVQAFPPPPVDTRGSEISCTATFFFLSALSIIFI